MIRRLLTFAAVAASTAVGLLYWLHDGDLAEAVEPVVADWNAEVLAEEAGVGSLGWTGSHTDEPSEAAAAADERQADPPE